MNATDNRNFKFIFGLMAVTLFTITSSIAYAKDKDLEGNAVECKIQITNKSKITRLKYSQYDLVIPVKDAGIEHTISLQRLNPTGDTPKRLLNDRVVLMNGYSVYTANTQAGVDEEKLKMTVDELDTKITLKISDLRRKYKVSLDVNGNMMSKKIDKVSNQAAVIKTSTTLPFKLKKGLKSKRVKVQASCSVIKTDKGEARKQSRQNKKNGITQE
jgi:hypothetical protein